MTTQEKLDLVVAALREIVTVSTTTGRWLDFRTWDAIDGYDKLAALAAVTLNRIGERSAPCT